jgi:serine/threonine-protein kinase
MARRACCQRALVSAFKSGLLGRCQLRRDLAVKLPEPKQLARDLVKLGILTRWQAEQLLYGYHRLVIGKYKLLDQLGTAPTGRLYLAEHAQMGRRHTIKVLAKRLAANPQAVKQFLAAAQTACGLDHRNISHVYDVIQDHERHSHYIVMEYVEGMDLDTLVQREGRLVALEAIDYLIQAAEGLSHAHAGGVVHGDLKPSNLLLDQTGTIKILEIGQAGTGATPQTDPVDESIEMAALGAVVFQPPELRGEAQAPEVSADVYSLGSVLAFLLTGQASIDAATATARLQERPELPPELIELCGRMMADNPADRLPTMGRVMEQLAPIVRQLVAA